MHHIYEGVCWTSGRWQNSAPTCCHTQQRQAHQQGKRDRQIELHRPTIRFGKRLHVAGACAGAGLGAGRLANEATMPTAIIGRVTATMILCTERTVVVLRKEKRRCKRRKRQRRQQHAAVLIGGLGDRQAKGSSQCVKSCFMRLKDLMTDDHFARCVGER